MGDSTITLKPARGVGAMEGVGWDQERLELFGIFHSVGTIFEDASGAVGCE